MSVHPYHRNAATSVYHGDHLSTLQLLLVNQVFQTGQAIGLAIANEGMRWPGPTIDIPASVGILIATQLDAKTGDVVGVTVEGQVVIYDRLNNGDVVSFGEADGLSEVDAVRILSNAWMALHQAADEAGLYRYLPENTR